MELKTQVMQKITLSANMQQCLEILAMDNVQLGEYITEQSMENPIIELADSGMCAEYSQAAIRAEREQPEDEEESGREIAALEHPNSDLYFQLSDADERTKEYIRERYDKARRLQDCTRKRQQTLLKIAELIFKNQKCFLLNGPSEIRPLTLKEAADELEMSSSTVSRAVKGKYIQTRWGIYSLRYFFGGGIRTEEGTVSAAQIRAVIGRMIAKEDKAHPFSDKKIEMMLKERGMSVSRRTVAAYREQMDIPASSVRRAEYLYKKDR